MSQSSWYIQRDETPGRRFPATAGLDRFSADGSAIRSSTGSQKTFTMHGQVRQHGKVLHVVFPPEDGYRHNGTQNKHGQKPSNFPPLQPQYRPYHEQAILRLDQCEEPQQHTGSSKIPRPITPETQQQCVNPQLHLHEVIGFIHRIKRNCHDHSRRDDRPAIPDRWNLPVPGSSFQQGTASMPHAPRKIASDSCDRTAKIQ